MHRLPSWVDFETREKAEEHLARLATQFRPDQVAKLADRLTDCLNPDGEFSDEDRARRRGLTLTKQDVDGMSRLCGWVTPELRAGLEAIWAKLAAPGMCNPEDHTPVIDDKAGDENRHPAPIPAATPNASMMARSTPHCARCWPAKSSASTTGYRPAIVVSTTLKDLESGCR